MSIGHVVLGLTLQRLRSSHVSARPDWRGARRGNPRGSGRARTTGEAEVRSCAAGDHDEDVPAAGGCELPHAHAETEHPATPLRERFPILHGRSRDRLRRTRAPSHKDRASRRDEAESGRAWGIHGCVRRPARRAASELVAADAELAVRGDRPLLAEAVPARPDGHERMTSRTSSRFRSISSSDRASRFSRRSGSVFDGRTLKCQSVFSTERPSR